MTRELQALRPVGLTAAITAAFLGLLLVMGTNGLAWLITPGPDEAAGEMLHALAAHREPAAHRELSRELQAQVTPERLPRLGSISRVDAETVDEQEERATVRATVRVGAGEEREVALPLVKEDGLWRVASVEPLRALTR